ncbi:TIGR04282 family arsenosugar biosynthesis glycosyltransferase [Aquibacillus kalidii]|uniref:TIGR04282 family arsenosugar biosynthesis glycosyltransferase n=1 Tax=Aquibacillus kalidii TaxID=2762597 RepID=UPI001647AD7B|nr:TIGR04282 family arsenosugar biosynthesis glycosyltransferase [Aquibacillus kalidii]
MAKPVHKKPVLLILSKAPIPGYCKTRLEAKLSSKQCAQLQDSLIRDLSELYNEMKQELEVWVAYTPHHTKEYFEGLFPSSHFPQVGNDLGERMKNALSFIMDKSYSPVIIIGTDTPLNIEDIRHAFKELNNNSFVIGPATDGGYYLIGMHQYEPDLFSDIPWSSDKVCSLTIKKMEQLSGTVSLLAQKRDIDEFRDLEMYQGKNTNHHLTDWMAKNLTNT